MASGLQMQSQRAEDAVTSRAEHQSLTTTKEFLETSCLIPLKVFGHTDDGNGDIGPVLGLDCAGARLSRKRSELLKQP